MTHWRGVVTVAGAACAILWPHVAAAQEPTFFTVTYYEAASKSANDARDVLKTYRDDVRKLDGNVKADLLESQSRKGWFVIFSAWREQRAYDQNVSGAVSKQFTEQFAPLQVAPSDTRQLVGLAVAPAKAGAARSCAVTHVDVVPANKDNVIAALKPLAEESRKHPGNVAFDVFQQTDRPNHFTLVECWATRRDFDTHVSAAETKAFRGKLTPITGALYDERLYRAVK